MQWVDTPCRLISNQLTNQIDCYGTGALRREDFRPVMVLDKREVPFCVHVELIHRVDLVTGRRSQHLYYLYELVDATLSLEQRLAQK